MVVRRKIHIDHRFLDTSAISLMERASGFYPDGVGSIPTWRALQVG